MNEGPAPPEADLAVSVIIPCYNSAAFVAETVDSVLAQTSARWEIVFVDDGSTDGTPATLDGLVATHAARPMRVFTQANAGVAAARNLAISHARGRYVLPLDADDLIAPTMLETCAAVLDAQPQTAIVFTDRRDFGALQGTHPAGRFEVGRLKYFNQLASCAMFRREMWQAIGGYRVNVSGFDDWDFWLAAAARGFSAHHLPQPLFHHRRHHGSQLGHVMPDYERLYANIILNNAAAYTPAELAQAQAFLLSAKPSPLLRASKALFTQHYPIP